MRKPISLPPRPWRTDLTIEAGLVFDAAGVPVLAVDPFSDRTTDAEAHAIASAVVAAVNQFCTSDDILAILVAQSRLSRAVSEAFKDLQDAGEVPVAFNPVAKPIGRSTRSADLEDHFHQSSAQVHAKAIRKSRISKSKILAAKNSCDEFISVSKPLNASFRRESPVPSAADLTEATSGSETSLHNASGGPLLPSASSGEATRG